VRCPSANLIYRALLWGTKKKKVQFLTQKLVAGALACTAERFIPPDAEAFAQKNAKRLADLHASAMESQKSKIRYLRSLVARISTALSKVPAAIFLNVSERARRRAKARRNAVQDAFLEDKKAWQVWRRRQSCSH
jgi:hypothetical protein